jgi:hypothetical protein
MWFSYNEILNTGETMPIFSTPHDSAEEAEKTTRQMKTLQQMGKSNSLWKVHSVHSPKVSELVLVSVSSSISLTLGRKFAQIEVVVFLVMVVRQWEICLMDGLTRKDYGRY